MSCGQKSVRFYIWDIETGIQQLTPQMNIKEGDTASYEHLCFLPGTKQALTVNSEGDAILWSDNSLHDLSRSLGRGKKAAIKIMR
jgi:hypothetical protein